MPSSSPSNRGARRPALRTLCAWLALALLTSAAQAGEPIARRWTPEALSSDQYESSPTFTPDGREIYFMRADRNFGHYRLLWSRCENGDWTAPVEAPFAAPAPALEADPFVTFDGRQLYYVSARHDPDNDDLDIWHVDREPDGRWGRPQRLPEPVNSSGAELLPRQTSDGRLYFGSSRDGGYGQGDIYVATRAADGGWRVDNVGPPISTAANEYEAEISRDGRTMIVVADRGDRSHLYRYALRGGRWVEQGRVPAFDHVFQIGPLLSPDGKQLMYAQADGDRSGEIFLLNQDREMVNWPPTCNADKRLLDQNTNFLSFFHPSNPSLVR